MPKKTLDALLADKAKLKAVLLYHVVGKKLPAAKVVKRKSARTLNGAKVRFRVKNGKVFVNKARVTQPDVMASNGVIHVINRVLLPRASDQRKKPRVGSVLRELWMPLEGLEYFAPGRSPFRRTAMRTRSRCVVLALIVMAVASRHRGRRAIV